MDLKILVLCLISFQVVFINGFILKSQKIVNGAPAEDREFPFMVSIRTRAGTHNCGGTILNSDTILTAGHCVCGYQDPLPTIQYGVNDISVVGETVVQMRKIICHENYTVFGNEYAHNDIAIVKLKSDIILSDSVRAVALDSIDTDDSDEDGRQATVVGWGYNLTDGWVQNRLQKVDVPLISLSYCKSLYPDRIVASNICAGRIEGGSGQCSGDSGGPLLVNGVQVGIVSWSVKPCGSAGNPGIFTRISSFYTWIHQHI